MGVKVGGGYGGVVTPPELWVDKSTDFEKKILIDHICYYVQVISRGGGGGGGVGSP